MKKTLLPLLLLFFAVGVKAQTYKYLTFTNTDGEETSIAALGTVITFDGTNVIAKTTDSETYTFSLATLHTMRFAETATAIAQATLSASQNSPVEVYDTTGRLVLRQRANATEKLSEVLPQGIYIIRTGGKTQKRIVR